MILLSSLFCFFLFETKNWGLYEPQENLDHHLGSSVCRTNPSSFHVSSIYAAVPECNPWPLHQSTTSLWDVHKHRSRSIPPESAAHCWEIKEISSAASSVQVSALQQLTVCGKVQHQQPTERSKVKAPWKLYMTGLWYATLQYDLFDIYQLAYWERLKILDH